MISAADGPSQEVAKLQVEIQADSTVSYASYQNNVPLVRSLTLANATGEPLRDIEVALRCEPAFAEPLRLRFERLEAKETLWLDALDLKFRHRYLAELTEAERGCITPGCTNRLHNLVVLARAFRPDQINT